jgi:transcriptional regulator with XRE-family HTH domain
MTDRDQGSELRAARAARGWSQSDAARELAALAGSRGATVGTATSLKTLLSRWENGHSTPEPQYRVLLADLYGRSGAELGLTGADTPVAETGGGLLAALASAAAAAGAGLELWRRQLVLARELDDELGAAGAAELVKAQVDGLAETLLHTVDRSTRADVAAVLTAAAALAGAQALDRTHHEQAWRRYDQARGAAWEADLPAAAAVAVSGQAAVLVDAGDAGAAIQLLEQAAPGPGGDAQARLDAAMALARAVAGDQRSSRAAMAAATRRLDGTRIDLVDRRDGPPVELADLHRWQGRVLVELGDPGAVGPLQRALAAGQRSTRHRASVHADLALILRDEHPQESAEHARAARRLATGIGSQRIPARLAGLGSSSSG